MADRYDVDFTPAAARGLRKLDRVTQTRLLTAIGLLRDTPRPPTVKSLSGHRGYLRVRVGDHRIVYRVDDGILLVLVLSVGHRREVYRRL